MSDKRRDNKGRILRTGESQRKNGMYEFRYTAANKKRRSIYDMDLMKLRKKEDEIKILLGTGMRISEFCGLTISDLDFDRRRIRVDHPLVRTRDGKSYIEKTKTECGCRYIPMSDEVYESFYNILSNRKKQKKEVMIDGYAGFILLDKNGNPKVAMHIQKVVQRLCEKYNEENIILLPRITPHVFRHTFCTNMANAGMDLKSQQYLMGHSDASVTLNVCTHNSYEKAEESMAQIVSFSGRKPEENKVRRFG